jgi:hypothetical protein
VVAQLCGTHGLVEPQLPVVARLLEGLVVHLCCCPVPAQQEQAAADLLQVGRVVWVERRGLLEELE